MDKNWSGENGVEPENLNSKESHTNEVDPMVEPYKGMIFESEETAKEYYVAYATQMGFVVRVDSYRRSPHDGTVCWRQLVCNKEGHYKSKSRRTENRNPRTVTREGCKARIVFRREKAGNWIVSKFFREHSHPLNVASFGNRRTVFLSQTPDEKDVRIRELMVELQKERKKSAALQAQLDTVLQDMEERSNHLSRNIDDIAQSVREIDANRIA